MDRNWRVDCPKLNELVGKLNKLLLADGRDNILGKLDAAKEQWDAAEKYKKDLQNNSDRPKSRELGKRRWEYFENVVAKEQSLRDLDPKEPFDGHIWEVHERLVTLQEEREVLDGHLADFYCPCRLDLGKTNLLPDALVESIVIYGWVPPH
ncbi:MAG: hypothetical protein KDA57_11895 [Planctomycetales bacterium]|nr:hypothetical protein [Planctomycetales bacterium]